MIRTLSGVLTILLCGFGSGLVVAADFPAARARGVEFHRIWDSPVRAKLDRTPLRSALEQLCSARKVGFVIDRRLDPDKELACELLDLPLSEFLPTVLESIQAEVVVIGNSLVIGPQEPQHWLRTLAAIQRSDQQAHPGTAAITSERARQIDLRWPALSDPRQLILDLAKRGKIQITGTELIPYDQWGEGDLIGVTSGEALTVLASQYDLRLRWTSATTAELVPLEPPVAFTKSLTIATARRDSARIQFPELTWVPQGNAVRVSGRVEEIEGLERWLKGGSSSRPRTPAKSTWRTREYTLKVVDTPVLTLLQELQKQGFPVEYDEAELKNSGITATSKLDLDVQSVTADELISQVCLPFGWESQATESGIVIHAPKR